MFIAECLSPSNPKGAVQELPADYAQIAVPEDWLLDPALPRFTSYVYASGAMQERLRVQSGVVQPHFANVHVDLAALWAAFQGIDF